jgi:Fur family transcriptional regulator, ferric uptake regulator
MPLTKGTGTITEPGRRDTFEAAAGGGEPRRAPQERSTRQKRALAAVLQASDGFRSVQELHAELQARGENIALTTIYNQVRALAEAGELDALRSDEGETRYRRCRSDDHHHHLVCRHCGTALEIEGPEVERWATQIGGEHGFTDVTHTLEVIGTCPACSSLP